MGYRSNGKIWLSEEAQKELPISLKEDLKDNWEKESGNCWSFYDWKWYETYDDVKLWIKFMKICEDKELFYEFARTGEELEDNEIIGTEPYTKFSISRTIEQY